MGLYAHWLDGEYVNITTRLSGGPPDAVRLGLNRVLKIHVLIGTTFDLVDQYYDNIFILDLFSDLDFVSYLQRNPWLMRVIARAKGEPADRFGIATAGLHRCLNPGWASSVLPEAEPVKALAEAILSDRTSPPAERLKDISPGSLGYLVYKKWPKYSSTLEKMTRVIDHFVSGESGSVVDEPPSNTSVKDLYSILKEEAKKQREEELPVAHFETTLKHIDREIENPDERKRRSVIYDSLDTRVWPQEHQSIWHTVVHAWNSAVQESIGADGGDIIYLPHSTPVSICRQEPRGALIPLEPHDPGGVRPVSFQSPVASLTVKDVAHIGWRALKRIADETETTRRALVLARAEGDAKAIQQAAREHAEALGPHFAKEPLPPSPLILQWLDGVALVLGPKYRMLKLLRTPRVAYENVADFVKGGCRYIAVSVLEETIRKIVQR